MKVKRYKHTAGTSWCKSLIRLIEQHEQRVGDSLNFTPSENRLSPLARLPLVSDIYARYFLNDLRLFGSWAFHGGKEAGEIENKILHPLLQNLAGANRVNTRPISGINCMMVALTAVTRPGDTVMALPLGCGGHASTRVVIESIGRRFRDIPMKSPHDLNVKMFASALQKFQPSLVYLDQATMLFPLDASVFRNIIDSESPSTILHYDSSHLNGLILGDAIPNPLVRGAHIFGGSTHKTLPGPHKAFLATNSNELADRIDHMSSHLVSHHHTGAMVSLAITLLEHKMCGGNIYARQVIDNAQVFAAKLHQRGIDVAASERQFTGCHQVWVTPPMHVNVARLAIEFEHCSLIVNTFNSLPGINRPSLRISLAEATRMGAGKEEAAILGEIFSDLILKQCDSNKLRKRAQGICSHLSRPRYCFDKTFLTSLGISQKVKHLWARQAHWIN